MHTHLSSFLWNMALVIVVAVVIGCTAAHSDTANPDTSAQSAPTPAPHPLLEEDDPELPQNITLPDNADNNIGRAEDQLPPARSEQSPETPAKEWAPPQPLCPKQPLGEGFQVGAVEMDGANEPLIRVTRHVFNWSDAETKKDEFDYEYLEQIAQLIDSESCQGRTVMLVIVSTPKWAVEKGTVGTGVPYNLYLPVDDPENYWARFVKKIAGIFQDRVDHWIVWNEADIKPTDDFHVWDGTPEELAQLQRIAYLAMRQGNTNAKIHLGSLSQWNAERYFKTLLGALAQGPDSSAHGYYFDYVSLNAFHSVQEYRRLVLAIKNIMQSFGIEKPIWIMEANFLDPPFGDEVQAAWLVQAAASALAGGADGFMIYQWEVNPENPYPVVFGIEKKPAADALRTVGEYLTGPYDRVEFSTANSVWRLTIYKTGKRISVLWNFAGLPQQTIFSPLPGSSVRMINKYGEHVQFAQNGTAASIHLGPARAYVPREGYWVGGEPVIVIETYGEENIAPLEK